MDLVPSSSNLILMVPYLGTQPFGYIVTPFLVVRFGDNVKETMETFACFPGYNWMLFLKVPEASRDSQEAPVSKSLEVNHQSPLCAY